MSVCVSVFFVCDRLKGHMITCQVESKGDETMITRQELQRLLPLNQSSEVVGQGLAIEEVVHTDQEIPEETPQLAG